METKATQGTLPFPVQRTHLSEADGWVPLANYLGGRKEKGIAIFRLSLSGCMWLERFE